MRRRPDPCVVRRLLRRSALLLALPFVAAPAAAGPHPRVETKQACVSPACHDALGRAASAGGSLHEPFAGGECRSCHDLALPPGAAYVAGAPARPAEADGGARAWDLALCLGCHGEALLAANAPAGANGFLDGRKNLHALHVQAGRGRRCLTCHHPHEARQPKLLRERIPARGTAQVAQQFRGEPQGGWCRTGCHAPKRYTR